MLDPISRPHAEMLKTFVAGIPDNQGADTRSTLEMNADNQLKLARNAVHAASATQFAAQIEVTSLRRPT